MSETSEDVDFRRTFAVRSAPETLERAVSTADGVSGWWWPTQPIGHEQLHVAMGDSGVDVEVRRDGAETVWHVVACPIEPDWVGPDIAFNVKPAPDGASLTFIPPGLAALPCADVCFAGWSYYLPSLVAYAETGVGTPGPKQV